MVQPVQSKSYWGYFNPLNIVRIPFAIFGAALKYRRENPKPMDERDVVVYRAMTPLDDQKELVLVEEDRLNGRKQLLDCSSNEYPIAIFKLDNGIELEVAKFFLTDIERSGEPDEFWIDGKKIAPPAPRTLAEKQALLKQMLQMAKGDTGKVKEWTELLNYRLKIDLVNVVMSEFHKEYGLNPVFGRNGFTQVAISLDTKKDLLTCEVSGKIEHATDENVDTHEMNIQYVATSKFTSDSVEQGVVFKHL